MRVVVKKENHALQSAGTRKQAQRCMAKEREMERKKGRFGCWWNKSMVLQSNQTPDTEQGRRQIGLAKASSADIPRLIVHHPNATCVHHHRRLLRQRVSQMIVVLSVT